MIDIENKVFNDISVALSNAFSVKYPNMSKYSEYVELPSAFPCVSLYEESNEIIDSRATLQEKEEYATIYYICNIYTTDGKQSAKEIAKVVSDGMKQLNFVRTFYNPIPNADRSIYRITMRFRGVVSKGIIQGDTITYKVY